MASQSPRQLVTDEKTEAPRRKVTCPKVPEAKIESRSLGGQCKLEDLVEAPLPGWRQLPQEEGQSQPAQGLFPEGEWAWVPIPALTTVPLDSRHLPAHLVQSG